MNIENNRSELEEGSFLFQHPRESGFKAPEGYFDTFDARLTERLQTEQEQPKASSARVVWLSPRYAAAAAVVLLLLSVAFWQPWTASVEGKTMAENSAIEALQEVSLEEAEAYVLEHIEEFDEELLMASMGDEVNLSKDLSEEELNQYLEDEGLENLSDEELEQLL